MCWRGHSSPCCILQLGQRHFRDLHQGVGIEGSELLGRGAGSGSNGLCCYCALLSMVHLCFLMDAHHPPACLGSHKDNLNVCQVYGPTARE